MIDETMNALANPTNKVVFLTGAGISTASGIPDFQELDRDWPFEYPRLEMSSLPFFTQEPDLFWQAFWHRLAIENALPNIFHGAVATLQQANDNCAIVTQNTDGLHEMAGSKNILEVHGSIKRLICLPNGCENIFNTKDFEPHVTPHCPECNNVLKPDVSLFFEGINYMYEARQLMLEADYIIIAGTSLRVAPINELPYFAHYQNPKARQLWVNHEAPPEPYDFLEIGHNDTSLFGERLLEALGQKELF